MSDIFPSSPMNDVVNGGFAKTELLSEGGSHRSQRGKLSYFKDSISVHAGPYPSVGVLGSGNGFEMIRIAAPAIPAKVVHLLSHWDRAVNLLPHVAMREYLLAVNTKIHVPNRVGFLLGNPTPVLIRRIGEFARSVVTYFGSRIALHAGLLTGRCAMGEDRNSSPIYFIPKRGFAGM